MDHWLLSCSWTTTSLIMKTIYKVRFPQYGHRRYVRVVPLPLGPDLPRSADAGPALLLFPGGGGGGGGEEEERRDVSRRKSMPTVTPYASREPPKCRRAPVPSQMTVPHASTHRMVNNDAVVHGETILNTGSNHVIAHSNAGPAPSSNCQPHHQQPGQRSCGPRVY